MRRFAQKFLKIFVKELKKTVAKSNKVCYNEFIYDRNVIFLSPTLQKIMMLRYWRKTKWDFLTR